MKRANIAKWGMVALMILAVGTMAWAQSAKYSVGCVMYDLSNKFHTYIQEGMKRFVAENTGVSITVVDGKGDANTQINQIETMITKRVNAIVLTPVDTSTIPAIAQKCKAANVKLVIVNLIPNEEDMAKIDAYVGSESIDAGLMQGEWVAKKLNGKGNVGILIGDLGLEVARMRTKGNKDVFAKFPGIKVTNEAEGKWDRAQAQRIAENWIQADTGKKLSAIVCNNDEMAIGAWFAAKAANRTDIVVAGIDATPDALEYLGNGLGVTVYQSGYGQGYGSLKAAYDILTGKKVEKKIWIPFELVTPDKKAEYQAKWK